MRDPYDVLGIARTASDQEIHRAYRKLAKKLHPDVNPDNSEGSDRFKEIVAAHDILSDSEKRARFDRGEIDASGAERPEYAFNRHYAQGGGGQTTRGPFGFDDMGAIFNDIFGGGQASGARRSRMRARGRDTTYSLRVGFLEAANGAKKRVTMPDGRTLDVTIPAGFEDRHTLRLKGQGAPGMAGGEPGDAYVEVHIEPHAYFTRKDNDIHVELPVTLAEAVLGGKVKGPTINGPVTMTIPKGSNTGTTLRLKGKGALDRRSKRRGDQYVKLKVVLPDRADPELQEFLARWAPDHPYDPRGRFRNGS
jgi:DnaJ-class molecular chaperone